MQVPACLLSRGDQHFYTGVQTFLHQEGGKHLWVVDKDVNGEEGEDVSSEKILLNEASKLSAEA